MHYITGSEDLPIPIYTIPDTRERWQQQTCEGTAEAKVILEFVVLGPWLSEIHPSGLSLLVGWHPEVNCHLLLLWHGHWRAPLSWIRDKSFPKYMDDSCWVTGVWLQQYMHHQCWVIGVSLLQYMHRECWDTGLSLPQYIHHEHWVSHGYPCTESIGLLVWVLHSTFTAISWLKIWAPSTCTMIAHVVLWASHSTFTMSSEL